jgi:hypothetical protein
MTFHRILATSQVVAYVNCSLVSTYTLIHNNYIPLSTVLRLEMKTVAKILSHTTVQAYLHHPYKLMNPQNRTKMCDPYVLSFMVHNS